MDLNNLTAAETAVLVDTLAAAVQIAVIDDHLTLIAKDMTLAQFEAYMAENPRVGQSLMLAAVESVEAGLVKLYDGGPEALDGR